VSSGAPDASGLSGAPPAPPSSAGAISSGPTTPAPNSGFPRIDKYDLIEEIGHGGMATVYRARDPRLGREVAVKVIHKHLRENPEVGTRFVAEARAAAKLRHPCIVDVFDVSGDDDPERYLVVELIRGSTLRKVLQQHRDMPAEIGAAIVHRLCDALTHAHASSIVHRDIKPENVLVELAADRAAAIAEHEPPATPRPPPTPPAPTLSSPVAPVALGPSDTQQSPADVVAPRGTHDEHKRAHREPRAPSSRPRDDAGVVIKLTDFGIAKILDAQGVTSTGQVLGSPAHMAPEQIEGGDVDPRTDVFALGVLMYECLVGHLPFEGKNPAQVLRRVLEGTYSPADRERPTVGGRWARIVAAALARDPAERTASAAELGEAIVRELAALGIDDPRAEICAYFDDPAAYTEALASRLVPRLVARGEAARRSGDIPGAAADFNRALALHPDDLAILKRIGSLTTSAGRRQMMRRAAAVAAGSLFLGLVAFQVSRAWKTRTPPRKPTLATSASAVADPPDDPPPTSPTAPTEQVSNVAPSGTPTTDPVKRPRIAATPIVVPAPPPPTPGTRMVYFNLNPKGAKLVIDGSPRSGFRPFSLPVGVHRVEVTPNVERCCKKLSTTVTVEAPPANEPKHVQQIPLAMEIRPATVMLNGPPNGQLFCSGLGLTCFTGSSKQVKLREPSWTGTCTFSAPEKMPRSGRVTLNAGDVNTVGWQGD
jgi:eukaryotic-like serine/threonine-protein kinase